MKTLKDLVKSFSNAESDEQLEMVRRIRDNKFVLRPATEDKKKRAARPIRTQTRKILDGLSQEEIAQLLAEIENDTAG